MITLLFAQTYRTLYVKEYIYVYIYIYACVYVCVWDSLMIRSGETLVGEFRLAI